MCLGLNLKKKTSFLSSFLRIFIYLSFFVLSLSRLRTCVCVCVSVYLFKNILSTELKLKPAAGQKDFKVIFMPIAVIVQINKKKLRDKLFRDTLS